MPADFRAITNTNKETREGAQYSYLPAKYVNFILNYQHVNSKYAIKIKRSNKSMDIRKYTQKKYKWNNQTVESIWWEP